MTAKVDERIRAGYKRPKPEPAIDSLNDLTKAELDLIIEGLTEREMWSSGYDLADRIQAFINFRWGLDEDWRRRS